MGIGMEFILSTHLMKDEDKPNVWEWKIPL